MKIKTSELIGAALDWAAAKAAGYTRLQISGPRWTKPAPLGFYNEYPDGDFAPSTDWAQGGPIIEREGIELKRNMVKPILWAAFTYSWAGLLIKSTGKTGNTPLIAAMRCYVASKLGDEVEVPDELCA